MGNASENPMGVEMFSLIAGLGFVLSFGYWCTDFLVIQRAMAARNMSDARKTPVIAAFPKMFMPFIVILPGIAAIALLRRGAPDSHYLMVGRLTTVFGIALSLATAYLAAQYNNIMDLLQLVFGFVNAPLFATFLLGMFWRRATAHGAFFGLLSGTGAAALTHGMTMAEGKGGWISVNQTFPSTMAQNFWIAIFAWTTCFLVTILVSMMTKPKEDEELRDLVWGLTKMPPEEGVSWYRRPGPLAVIVAVICIALNFIFW
jgi:SSS family solute:Na+ symporter